MEAGHNKRKAQNSDTLKSEILREGNQKLQAKKETLLANQSNWL